MKQTLDDIWLEPPAFDQPESLVRRRRRRYRMIMTGVVGLCYLVDTAFVYLFSLIGRAPPALAVIFGLAGLCHVALFGTLHATGISERARSKHLTEWQMVYAISLQLVAMVLAPQVKAYFLALIFVIYAFGMMRLPLRTALIFWVSTCVSIAGVLVAFPETQVTPADIADSGPGAAIVGASFALVLLRCLLINYYATLIRLRLNRRTNQLASRIGEIQEIATHDRLTGALNRHAIMPFLEEHLQLTRRGSIVTMAAMLDIDLFKHVNDRFGHLAGDAVLKAVVATMSANIRPADKLARYGGEEFLVIMPSTSLADALEVVERVRERIAQHDWRPLLGDMRITVSAGLTQIGTSDSVDEIIARADTALYRSKALGRNQTTVLLRDRVPVP